MNFYVQKKYKIISNDGRKYAFVGRSSQCADEILYYD